MKQTPVTAPAWALQSVFQRAVEHHQAGRLHEAELLYRQIVQAAPRHADALHLLGVLALQAGDFDVAGGLIQQAIAIRPADNFHCNLGNVFLAQGKRSEAIASYRRALALNANLAQALSNLGNALLEQGEVDEAVACGRRAAALQPGLPQAHVNLGNALLTQGHLDEAIRCYRQALLIAPGLALAHSHLGDALCLKGLPDQAIACYQQAVQIGPDSADLRCRWVRALRQRGPLAPAIDCAVQALKFSDHVDIRTEFVQTIKAAHFQTAHAEVRANVVRALEEVWADPGDLLTPATSLIECSPAVKDGIARSRSAAAGAPGQPAAWPSALWAELAADRLLLTLLQTDAVNSIPLERLLTAMRRQMLDAAALSVHAQGLAVPPAQNAADSLSCAIARQCFINEYVYACSDSQLQGLTQLHARLAACLADGSTPDPRWLIASAAYAPLSALPGAETWAGFPWPAPLAALFTQQVTEPCVERGHRAGMARLTDIDDPVSRRVQHQYEENPYPRWIHAPRIAAPASIDRVLRRQFPGAPFQPVGKVGTLDVLVAGCGTGQHPIQVAQQFEGARVLAVDLSLASLCYAKRKTEEIGLNNIAYARADILNLGRLEQRFDLIESVGVLHHLGDPVAGWRVLRDLLRPGGFMALGFYSELGRRDVVAARDRMVATRAQRGEGLPSDAVDIRRCRQDIMADDVAPQFEQFLASRDFYSTSACRDLLFHVQEQRYTLPQLQLILAQLRLKFIGFLLDPEVTAAYARQFPDDPAKIDLGHWHAFETARPDTFSRMYQFWVQKPH